MKLIDLHCDTLSQMRKHGASICDNELHVSLRKAEIFKPYIQVCAVWSDSSLSDDGAWSSFWEVTSHFKSVDGYEFIRSANELEATVTNKQNGFILACEGARLLCGDIDRLDQLYEEGVRILTLTWAGSDIIGGAHDTNDPLTPFGRQVTERCLRLGIIPDISHASRKVTGEVLELSKAAGKPPIATHSNSFTEHSHQRNLTDEEFSDIISLGGIVGISFAPQHLTKNSPATIEDVVRHIKHYVNIGGASSIALGCDFDGIDSTPMMLSDISRLPLLFDALVKSGFSEDDVENIFFNNAQKFLNKNL